MAYVRKEWDLGEVRQIEKYYPGNYGAPGKKRKKKRERTPEDIERQNRTNRGKKVQRLILANFKPGDWHLILSYTKEKRPKSDEEAKKQIRKFLEQLRKEYRAAGHELKYIYVTEKGKKGAWHHHLIIEDIVDPPVVTAKVVQKLWKHGHPTFNPLYEEGEYKMLADYIVKKETKEEGSGCTYSRSRNLVVPKPKRNVIHRKAWTKEPVPPKGWYVEKNSVENGINPVTGYPYQHYTIIKVGGNTS